MDFCLVGLSYKTAPVEVRERLAFSEERLPEALHSIASLPGIAETFILSTCNRVEVLARAEFNEANAPIAISDFLARFHGLEHRDIEQYLYHYRQREAIRHLFRVASSLDSMVIGEAQILG